MEALTFCVIPFGTPAFDEWVALRDRVLRAPLGLQFAPADLAEEYAQIHLGVYDGSWQLLGGLVLIPANNGVWKMRQVAVLPEMQAKGIGRVLVSHAEALARAKGCRRIVLHARRAVVSFYKKSGYRPIGRPFTEIGIPHQKMGKDIAS